MLEQQCYALRDEAVLCSLVDEHGWATLVSMSPAHGLVVSHVPLLLEEPDAAAPASKAPVRPRAGRSPGPPEAPRRPVSVLGHLARDDAELHGLGTSRSVLVLQGPNGYVSPAWYGPGRFVPTWNFVVAHLYGTCELLGEAETMAVLERTVEHYEKRNGTHWSLAGWKDYALRIVSQVSGFRLRPDRIVAKAKLSQDKPGAVAANVVDSLERSHSQGQHELAAAMREALYSDGRAG